MKVCSICLNEISTRDGENLCQECQDYIHLSKEKKKRIKARRSAMDEAAESCGLVKVKGAMGGTYYE